MEKSFWNTLYNTYAVLKSPTLDILPSDNYDPVISRHLLTATCWQCIYLRKKFSLFDMLIYVLKQNMIKYILALSVLFLLFTMQYSPKLILFNKLFNKINFINEFPDIKPEKCLKSRPFIGGTSKVFLLLN